jgi:hypothetical protein
MKNDNKGVEKKLTSRLKLCCPIKNTLTLFYGHENHGKMIKTVSKT